MHAFRHGSIAAVAFFLWVVSSLAAEESDQTWRVEGRVIDADDRPVADAVVSIPRMPGIKLEAKLSTTTDAEGRFKLASPIAPAGLVLQATSNDGRQLAYTRLAWELKPMSPVEPVELVLKAARELSIDVQDDRQTPVAGATVIAVAGYQKMDSAATGDDGTAAIRVPADAELQAVVALKPGVGLDYYIYRSAEEPISDPYKLAPDHSDAIAFVLNGTRQVAVRVVDDQDQPLVACKVYPWLLSKPRKGDHLNLSGLTEFSTQTDSSGVATFDVIPTDNERDVTFWVKSPGFYRPERVEFKPDSGETQLVAKLLPLVPVSGIVRFADGRPAAAIGVKAAGAGYSMDRYHEDTTTDAAGKFTLNVYPDQYYQFAAGDREWASAPINKIVRAGEPVDGLELKLEPAKRVHGRVTIGADHKPVAGMYVQLYQKNAVDYYDLPESDQLLNPKDSTPGIQPLIVQQTQTDSEGLFEFFTGPGKYCMYGPNGVEPPEFELVDQASLEVNLHAERPDMVPIAGRVVLNDKPTQGIPDVRIEGVAKQSHSRLRDLRATSGADGRFTAERGPADMVVYAATPDRSLAGIVTIGPDDQEVVIPIAPTSSAHARLLDKETKTPLANRQIDYGVRIEYGNGVSSRRFGDSTTTDESGELTIDGLVVGQEYTLEAVAEVDGDGSPRSWTHVGKVTPTSTAVAEMGDVSVEQPYREPTLEERVAKSFADERSLDERLEARVRDAGFGYQNVLVIAGDPANELVQQIYDLEYDDELHDAAMNYLFLPVSTIDAERTSAAAQALAPRGITVPAAGDATLWVIDKSGALVAQSTGKDLSTDGTIDAEKLRTFLTTHAPELPDAEVLLADALVQARREDKRVFFQHSGPRCGWCFVLSRFLDDHHDLIHKEFVWVKLDGRMKNGQAVIDRVRKESTGGIPWFAFLDADGNELINSQGPEGNIGYPGEPESQIHFEKMLRTSPRQLTDSDIGELMAALKSDDD